MAPPPPSVPLRSSLLRHSGIAGAGGAIAVVSGVALDAAIAAAYGAGSRSDAYFVAARIPLLVQGVLTVVAHQALTPLFSGWTERYGRGRADSQVAAVATAATLAGLVVALIGSLGAWLVVRVTAPGLDTPEVELATAAARVTFLVIPLEVMADVLEAWLTGHYSFVAPAAAKAVRNLGAAAMVVLLVGPSTDPVVVAWAYLGGMVLLVIVEVVAVTWRGLRLRPVLRRRDPALREAARLCHRPLLGASVNPATRLVEQQVLSFLPAGAITIQAYAYRLISAAGGTVFFRAVTAALLPRLSRSWVTRDEAGYQAVSRHGLTLMLAVSVPLTVAVALVARPAVALVFGHGSFDSADVALLGWVLVAYAPSLIGSALQRGLLAPFYARLDTRTPLRNTVYGNAANIALLLVLLAVAPDDRSAVVVTGVAFSLAQYVHVAHAWSRWQPVLGFAVRGSRARAQDAP